MTQKELKDQKIVAQYIRSLEEELKILSKSQIAAGWTQRNAVIDHVYSNYQCQEKVLKCKEKWENITFKSKVLQGILKLLLPHRNIYGFYDVPSMTNEFETILTLAEEKDEFEIAALISKYQIRFKKALEDHEHDSKNFF
jgi:hypothetical protein